MTSAYTEASPAETSDEENAPEREQDALEGKVGQMIDDAHAFIRETLEPRRATATKMYKGDPLGNEEEGRSQVVMTVVRDTVTAMMPSLLRMFTGSERVVEFRPRFTSDDQQVQDREEQARQRTDYVNLVALEDNPGFLILHAAFKDAMVRKTGIVKWWWEDETRVEGTEYTGLSEANLQQLAARGDCEIELTGSEPGIAPGMPPTYAAKVKRTHRDGRARYEAVPPETVAWNRGARSFEDALIVVHTDFEKRLDELVAMGYERDVLNSSVGTSSLGATNNEADVARRFDNGENAFGEDIQDEATRTVRYDEAYVYLALDDHGQPDDNAPVALYRICFVGDDHVMVGEPVAVKSRPFAVFICDPEPHTIVGQDIADKTMDLELIESAIMRGTLDSLSLSLHPATEVVENMVNMGDVMNTENGRIIRARQPGMIREVKHSFVGADTLPMLEKTQEIKENRTGQSKAAAGLDADALQSSTKQAVASTLQKGQEQIEMLARMFAETGMKQLFRGLEQLLIEHQDRARVVRMRGKYVEIDPRSWDAPMDLVVNVALGAGMTDDKMQFLAGVAAKQEQYLGTLGPNNPLVGLGQLRHTLGRMVELAGWRNTNEFFKEITPEMEAEMDRAAAQPPPPPPEDPAAMAVAQAAMMKAQTDQQRAQAEIEARRIELQLRAQEIKLADEREREKIAAQTALQIREMELKHQHSIDRAALQAEIDLRKAALDAHTKKEVAEVNAAAKEAANGQAHEAGD